MEKQGNIFKGWVVKSCFRAVPHTMSLALSLNFISSTTDFRLRWFSLNAGLILWEHQHQMSKREGKILLYFLENVTAYDIIDSYCDSIVEDYFRGKEREE